ncbi:hypothetical protein, partial [Vibrio panuliri]|uniref:hypothetical protein n=1 Tax=Vibrio panuliri TaxID=1381081 RepID=UPI000ACB9FFE
VLGVPDTENLKIRPEFLPRVLVTQAKSFLDKVAQFITLAALVFMFTLRQTLSFLRSYYCHSLEEGNLALGLCS